MVILWSRMGTPLETPLRPDSTQYLSGTEWEYEDACRDAETYGRHVLVYRCTRELMLSSKDPAFDQKRQLHQLVDTFFTRFEGARGGLVGGYAPYESGAEFKKRLTSDLRELLPSFIVQPARRSAKPDGEMRSRAGQVATSVAREPLNIPEAYRMWLRKETGSLELLGLGGAQGRSFFLSSVYVPLVTAGGREQSPQCRARKRGRCSGTGSPGAAQRAQYRVVVRSRGTGIGQVDILPLGRLAGRRGPDATGGARAPDRARRSLS